MMHPRAQQSTSTMDRLKIVGMRWRVCMVVVRGVRFSFSPLPGGEMGEASSRRGAQVGGLSEEAQQRPIGSQANPVARPQRHGLRRRAVVDQRAVTAAVAEQVRAVVVNDLTVPGCHAGPQLAVENEVQTRLPAQVERTRSEQVILTL